MGGTFTLNDLLEKDYNAMKSKGYISAVIQENGKETATFLKGTGKQSIAAYFEAELKDLSILAKSLSDKKTKAIGDYNMLLQSSIKPQGVVSQGSALTNKPIDIQNEDDWGPPEVRKLLQKDTRNKSVDRLRKNQVVEVQYKGNKPIQIRSGQPKQIYESKKDSKQPQGKRKALSAYAIDLLPVWIEEQLKSFCIYVKIDIKRFINDKDGEINFEGLGRAVHGEHNELEKFLEFYADQDLGDTALAEAGFFFVMLYAVGGGFISQKAFDSYIKLLSHFQSFEYALTWLQPVIQDYVDVNDRRSRVIALIHLACDTPKIKQLIGEIRDAAIAMGGKKSRNPHIIEIDQIYSSITRAVKEEDARAQKIIDDLAAKLKAAQKKRNQWLKDIKPFQTKILADYQKMRGIIDESESSRWFIEWLDLKGESKASWEVYRLARTAQESEKIKEKIDEHDADNFRSKCQALEDQLAEVNLVKQIEDIFIRDFKDYSNPYTRLNQDSLDDEKNYEEVQKQTRQCNFDFDEFVKTPALSSQAIKLGGPKKLDSKVSQKPQSGGGQGNQ